MAASRTAVTSTAAAEATPKRGGQPPRSKTQGASLDCRERRGIRTGGYLMTSPAEVHAAFARALGALTDALDLWAARDDARPQPEVRRAANTAMDEIDAMVRELYAMRSRLVTETRAADDAPGRRAGRGGKRWLRLNHRATSTAGITAAARICGSTCSGSTGIARSARPGPRSRRTASLTGGTARAFSPATSTRRLTAAAMTASPARMTLAVRSPSTPWRASSALPAARLPRGDAWSARRMPPGSLSTWR